MSPASTPWWLLAAAVRLRPRPEAPLLRPFAERTAVAMTGPEHYRAAELLLSSASHLKGRTGEPLNPVAAEHAVKRAQVHATLALAAATALIDETPRSDSCDNYRSWQVVAGIDGSDY